MMNFLILINWKQYPLTLFLKGCQSGFIHVDDHVDLNAI